MTPTPSDREKLLRLYELLGEANRAAKELDKLLSVEQQWHTAVLRTIENPPVGR